MLPRAFTFDPRRGLLEELITPVGVSPHMGLSTKQSPQRINALWDTGATGVGIMKQLAAHLGLIPFSMGQVAGIGDANPSICPVYLLDLALPNGFILPRVEVLEVASCGPNAGMIIGMSVITLGDFAITNLGGKTCFTFRMPSMERLDFDPQPEAS